MLLLSLYLELSIGIILWLFGALLIGCLLFYMIFGLKWKTRIGVLEKDLASMTAKANSLEADLSTANYEKEKTAEELAKEKSKNADLYFKLKACEESKAAEPEQEPEIIEATAPLGFAQISVEDPKLNDLKIVEGIGPKLEDLLKESGVANLAVLAQAKSEDIKTILDTQGARFKLADPSTWPKQAQMAVDGNWDRLEEFQDFLKGGKE